MIAQDEIHRTGRSCTARVAAAAAVCILALPVRAGDAPLPVVADSSVWQARFERYVETELVQTEVARAAESLPVLDPQAFARILDQIQRDRMSALEERAFLPPVARIPIIADGITDAALEAARAYAAGRSEEALALLRAPELATDAPAQHLRAQILDELTTGSHPLYRLATIDLYRQAMRLEGAPQQRLRARLRIGELYLEIRFLLEATESLRELAMDPTVPEPFASAARAAFAEASYLRHEPTQAIETLARLDLASLDEESLAWAQRRHADSLAMRHRWTEAIELYRRVIGDPRDAASVEPLLATRLAFALCETGRADEAVAMLEPVLAREDLERPIQGVATLVLARAYRELGRYKEAAIRAARVPRILPRSRVAAIAAVEAIESDHLAGTGSLSLPPGAAQMVTIAPTAAEFGLLSYRIGILPAPGDTRASVGHRLGALSVTLPLGPVRRLAHDDLTARLAQGLAHAATSNDAPEGLLLDDAQGYLRPEQVEENVLLLAVESFSRAGRLPACARWARALASREKRPVRQGIGSWRQVTCMREMGSDREKPERVLALADGETAGPFALGLAALAAEEWVRRGDLSRAITTYERAQQTLAEPRLVGPVLLRQGELEAVAGDRGLARLHLLRGLTQTQEGPLAHDPLRKLGLVALRRLTRGGEGKTITGDALALARPPMDPWWAEALAYLEQDPQAPFALEGEGIFARSAATMTALDRLIADLRAIRAQREALARAPRITERDEE